MGLQISFFIYHIKKREPKLKNEGSFDETKNTYTATLFG